MRLNVQERELSISRAIQLKLLDDIVWVWWEDWPNAAVVTLVSQSNGGQQHASFSEVRHLPWNRRRKPLNLRRRS